MEFPTDTSHQKQHDKTQQLPPFSSPLRHKKTKSLRQQLLNTGSMESVASDVSMDVSDITMEVEKLSKVREDPEVGIKETNRLLKEIDQQMEMSFEIMEDRTSMVRQFLKERENADKQHRKRAQQMMSQFNDKISTMENTLGVKIASPKLNQTSMTQTEMIETINIEIQTSFDEGQRDENMDGRDLHEVVKSFTQDMKDVVQKQLLKEKQMIWNEIQKQRMKNENRNIDSKVGKANLIVDNLMEKQLKPEVQDKLKTSKHEFVAWLTGEKSSNDVIEDLPNDLRSLMNKEKIALEENSIEQETSALIELKSTCKKIDQLEASLDSVLHDIQENLNLNEDELTNLSKEMKESVQSGVLSKVKKDQLIKRLQNKYRNKDKSIDENKIKIKFDKLITKQEEIQEKEMELNQLVASDIIQASSFSNLLFNRNQQQQQQQYEKEQHHKSNVIPPLNSIENTDIYKDGMKYFEGMSSDQVFEKTLGHDLFHDLVKMETSNSKMQAVDIVHYQDITLDEVLKDYETELRQLREHLHEGKAYEEIDTLINANFDDAVPILTSEKAAIENTILENKPKINQVKVKLNKLKEEKDNLVQVEKKLVQKKAKLTLELKSLNRHVADHLIEGEKTDEIDKVEQRLVEVNDEMNKVQNEIHEISIRINGEEITNVGNERHKESLTEQLSTRREDLDKLSPFINKNSSRKHTNNEVYTETPAREDIESIIVTRQELSRKLIETENKIQEIITSNGYESSENEYSEQSQQQQVNFKSNKLNKKTTDKLLEIERELTEIDNTLMKNDVNQTNVEELKESSEWLKKTLKETEQKVKVNLAHPQINKNKKELQRVDEKIIAFKTKLAKNGVEDFDYNEDVTEDLLKTRLKYEAKLESIIDGINEDKEKKKIISNSMRYHIQVRDETKKKILTLDSDVEKIKGFSAVMKEKDNLMENLMQLETSAMEKKTEGLSAMILTAYKKLQLFLKEIEKKMQEKMENAIEEGSSEKKYLQGEEKKILATELDTIMDDIKQSQFDLCAIEKFKTMSDVSAYDNPLMKSLSERKTELLSNLENLHTMIEQEDIASDEVMLKKNLDKKIEIKQELSELEERMEDQETILKARLQKLSDIRVALENKLSNSIQIDDLKKAIALFKNENDDKVIEQKAGIGALFAQRKQIVEKLTSLKSGPDEDLFKQLNALDDQITLHINEIMLQQGCVDTKGSFLYQVLTNTAPLIEMIRTAKDLQTTISYSISDDMKTKTINNETIQQTFNELQNIEEMKANIKYMQDKNINLKDLKTLEELKELNETKLDILLKKIRLMNIFVEKDGISRYKQTGEEIIRQQKIVSDSQQLSKELEELAGANSSNSLLNSYTNDIKNNEVVMLTKSNIKNTPAQKTGLDFILHDRDSKLSRLFIIDKHLEASHNVLTETEINELQKEKQELEGLIEKIDKKIIDGDYDEENENEMETSTTARSFSPRSTSSRNSMTHVLDERDQIMKKIFQLEKQEDFLKQSEDILNKHSTLGDIQERREGLKQRLNELDERLHYVDLSEDTLIGDVQNETVVDNGFILNIPNQCNLYNEDIKTSLDHLKKEVESCKFETPADSGIVTDIKDILTNPLDTEVIETVAITDELLRQEKMKKKLMVLGEKKMKLVETRDCNELETMIEEKKKKLVDVNTKLNLIDRKEKLENDRKKIQRNTNKMKENLEVSGMLTKNDLKQNKINFEKNLDEINIVMSQYSNALEQEIVCLEDTINRDVEKQQQLEESLISLQSHKNDLEEKITTLKIASNVEEGEELINLLAKRRDAQKEIEIVEETLKQENLTEKKAVITNNLRKNFVEERQYTNADLQLNQKLKVIEKKINDVSIHDNKKNNIREKLGDDLYRLLNGDNLINKEKHLETLKICLEDRNISEYIKELSTLCSIQTEQIENLKKEKQTIKDKQNEELTQQIAILENELITVHEELAEKNEETKRLQEKIGSNLYELMTGTRENQAICRNITEQPQLLSDISTYLKQGTIEMFCQKVFTASQKVNETDVLLDELSKEKKLLKERLNEKDEEMELLKLQAGEYCSETESLRDNLREFEEKTCCFKEEAEKMKNECQYTKDELKWVTEEYQKLKADFDEIAKIKSSYENLQMKFKEMEDKREMLHDSVGIVQDQQLLQSTDETTVIEDVSTNLSIDHSDSNKGKLQDVDSLQRKIRRIIKEKTNLQEELESENKKVEKFEDELTTLKQREKFSMSEMHKHCQIIEKQERDLKTLKESTVLADKQIVILKNNNAELKEKYQALTTKHQNETAKYSKEVKNAKNKIDEQRVEIEKLNCENEFANSDDIKKMVQKENETYKKQKILLEDEINELKKRFNDDVTNLKKQNQELIRKYEETTTENQTLLKKLTDLDESFETELTETRKELGTKYTKSIDVLKEKVRSLANDLLLTENMKDMTEKKNTLLQDEKNHLNEKLKEQQLINETKDKTYRVQRSTLTAEIDALKLENDELRDDVIQSKRNARKVKDLEQWENQINEAKIKLEINAEQLQLEKSQLEETVQQFIKTRGNMVKDRCEGSVQLLKTTQEERDKISNELIDTNKELLQTRNEVRKLKTEIREKEEDFATEEQKLLTKYETQHKVKIENLQKIHLREKENLLKIYNEERNKYEEEIEIMKQNLQEENIRKLHEQRIDFENELQKQINEHLQDNLEELDELRDQVDVLKKQRSELLKQFEEDKTSIVKKYEKERNALEETIRRLLGNLLKLKEKRSRLRVSHEDEISELEERFESERDKMLERKEEEMASWKTKIKKTTKINIHEITTVLRETLENLVAEPPNNQIEGLKDKLDDLAKQLSALQETGGIHQFSLNDLKALVHMGNLDDILDTEYEAEQHLIKQSVTQQYKLKLREETNCLMKRLLELSDELESLRSYH